MTCADRSDSVSIMVDLHRISFLAGCDDITPIHAGFSSDKKYIVKKNETSYLLRTFAQSNLDEKRREFDVLRLMFDNDVKCSRPIELGLVDADTAYMLLTFIEGLDGEHAMPPLSSQRQYEIGIQAGEELKKINAFPAPDNVEPWNVRKQAKHMRYLNQYLEGDVRFHGDEKIIKFIDANLSVMKNRPNLFQHDDYHLRNLVFNDDGLAGVIDFGRNDWGDPFHEFLKVGQFNTPISIPFSVGQIKGYFDGNDPDEIFWSSYSLYAAMSLFSFVVWTKQVCPDQLGNTLQIINRVVLDHNYFNAIRPSWYVC